MRRTTRTTTVVLLGAGLVGGGLLVGPASAYGPPDDRSGAYSRVLAHQQLRDPATHTLNVTTPVRNRVDVPVQTRTPARTPATQGQTRDGTTTRMAAQVSPTCSTCDGPVRDRLRDPARTGDRAHRRDRIHVPVVAGRAADRADRPADQVRDRARDGSCLR